MPAHLSAAGQVFHIQLPAVGRGFVVFRLVKLQAPLRAGRRQGQQQANDARGSWQVLRDQVGAAQHKILHFQQKAAHVRKRGLPIFRFFGREDSAVQAIKARRELRAENGIIILGH